MNSEWPPQETLGQRRITDVWLALKVTARIFCMVTAVAVVVALVLSMLLAFRIDARLVLPCIAGIWLISSWFVIRVWLTYSAGVVVDAARGVVSFPATDVENSVIEILTMKPLLNHARRESLRISSIHAVMNETRLRRGHYAVNLSGNFGSRQLLFHSKQKRDEFRAAIDWAARETGTRPRQDRNVDTGGYHG